MNMLLSLRTSLRTAFPASLSGVCLNYLAAMSLLVLGYLLYTQHPYYRQMFAREHWLYFGSLSGHDILFGFVMLWAIVLPFYYGTITDSYATKSRLFWRALVNSGKRPYTREEKQALLSTAVKAFFLPLMLVWFAQHVATLIENAKHFHSGVEFFPHGYWFLFHAILLADVFFFTIGYAIEHPALGNEIRSVEPTLLGWCVALVCYPPFNGITDRMLGWYSSDYPGFDVAWAQYPAAVLILGLMAVYAWASVALNFKASNLTNRGIVTTGPYAWVRHPAYAAKNLAWWVGAIPILMSQWQQSASAFFFAVIGVVGWSVIYGLRAWTEERHLMADPDYRGYCDQVRYRFIPGIV